MFRAAADDPFGDLRQFGDQRDRPEVFGRVRFVRFLNWYLEVLFPDFREFAIQNSTSNNVHRGAVDIL